MQQNGDGATRKVTLPEDPAARERLVKDFFGSDFEKTLTPEGLEQLSREAEELGPSLTLSDLLGAEPGHQDRV